MCVITWMRADPPTQPAVSIVRIDLTKRHWPQMTISFGQVYIMYRMVLNLTKPVRMTSSVTNHHGRVLARAREG